MVIKVNNLTKCYKNFTALNDVSLNIVGGIVGLLGPNGAGKSTLIKCLMSLVSFQKGEVNVLGFDSKSDPRSIRQHIGYMPEDDCFIPGLQGVAAVKYMGMLSGLSSKQSLGRAHEICDLVGLAEERYRLTDTFSTGMRQKMKMAQAVVHDPELIILDEPTNGLDPTSRTRMLKLIEHLAHERGKTVILSTHLLGDVERICESAVILSQGKVLLEGEIANLRQSKDNTITVKIERNQDQFVQQLRDKNHTVTELTTYEFLVGGDDAKSDVIDVAARTNSSIKKMQNSRNSLEKVFLEAVSNGNN